MRIVKVNDFFKELKKVPKECGFVSMNNIHSAMLNCVITDAKIKNEVIEQIRTKCAIYYCTNSDAIMPPNVLDRILDSFKEEN